MKSPGAGAMELAWLPPSAGALAALTRPQAASAWTQVRHDPGCVLLVARAQGDGPDSFATVFGSLGLLETALHFLQNAAVPCIDWRQPAAARILTIAQRQARIAAELATRITGCNADRAWIGGLLAPLGWLALAAIPRDSDRVCGAPPAVGESEGAASVEVLRLLKIDHHVHDAARWQREHWGMDHTAIARRLSRLWRLPAWLTPIIGHLGLHVRIAERLGAEPQVFQTVQLAVALLQARERGLALPVGATIADLTGALALPTVELDAAVERALAAPAELPTAEPLAMLPDLLRLAIEQRREHETMTRLQQDLDHLQQALEQQCVEEKERLQALKLAALAELAAGAGHEINNPLAVISGQAQYLLKQMELAEEQLVEDPSPTLYLDSLKAKLHKALTTIIGQSNRIHHVLTDLMQFAKPGAPRKQPIGLATLVRDAAASQQAAAAEKKVQLSCAETPADLIVRGDAVQWRTALVNVLRNALEAAPPEGWVRVAFDQNGSDWVEICVEDSGPGPAAAAREHLFDPFYSGRTAGRGRGLGLSTAWRLARQNGGEVRYDGAVQGATRFVLRLPVERETVSLVGQVA